MSRKNGFSNGNFYHCINLGVEKRIVFMDKTDLDRFTAGIEYYRFKNPPARFSFRKREAYKIDVTLSPLVEIIAYSMMPNHFHLLLKQIEDGGVSQFLSKLTNSYTRYFNARNKRSGALFAGTFKSAPIDQEQLSKVSAYIHMEPVKQGLVINPERFPFSSYNEYLGKNGFCKKEVILKNFADSIEYQNFTAKGGSYDSSFKNILLD